MRWWVGGGGGGGCGGCGWYSQSCAPAALRSITLSRTLGWQLPTSSPSASTPSGSPHPTRTPPSPHSHAHITTTAPPTSPLPHPTSPHPQKKSGGGIDAGIEGRIGNVLMEELKEELTEDLTERIRAKFEATPLPKPSPHLRRHTQCRGCLDKIPLPNRLLPFKFMSPRPTCHPNSFPPRSTQPRFNCLFTFHCPRAGCP